MAPLPPTPVPEIVIGSATSIFPATSKVAPLLITVFALVVPSAVLFLIASVPALAVVVPEKVLLPAKVKVFPLVSFTKLPLPLITPLKVWLADEEYCKFALLIIFPE